MASRGVDGVTIPTQVGKTCGGTILGYLEKNGVPYHEVHPAAAGIGEDLRRSRAALRAHEPLAEENP